MGRKEVKVTFRTITPLWTGDAWQENNEIRPSSLIGGLRYWFAFYCKVEKHWKTENLNNGIPNESLSKLERPKEGKTLKILIRKYLKECESFDEAVDKALDELNLSIPSRIFGCTGWRSKLQIIIESYSTEKMEFKEVETQFPSNSGFWIKTSLFMNNTSSPILLFKNVEIKLITYEYWWNKYLEGFFKFFREKIILIGGKKSFGFGFVNLVVQDEEIHNEEIYDFQSINKFFEISKIKNINYSGNKKLLGFNFRYFLRLKENNRRLRRLNFGDRGLASKIYISNLLAKNGNNFIYFVVLNNPFDQKRISSSVIRKYKNWLNQLKKGGKNV